jgi:hypothetical protein
VVGRRGHDIVPARAQISRERGGFVQRLLRVLRGAKGLVFALCQGDRRLDTGRRRDEVVKEEGAVSARNPVSVQPGPLINE